MEKVWKYTTTILCILLAIALWHIYEHHIAYETLRTKNSQLEQSLAENQALLEKTQEERDQFEKKTLEGLLKETNEAVTDSWETLLDTVEKELNKARDTFKEQQQKEKSTDPSPPVPGEET